MRHNRDMENIWFIAHSGIEHVNEDESLKHIFFGSWYSALLVIILSVIILSIAYFISKGSLTTASLITQLLLLFGGLMLYQQAPAISSICIIIGFVLSLYIVIKALRSSDESNT